MSKEEERDYDILRKRNYELQVKIDYVNSLKKKLQKEKIKLGKEIDELEKKYLKWVYCERWKKNI